MYIVCSQSDDLFQEINRQLPYLRQKFAELYAGELSSKNGGKCQIKHRIKNRTVE